MGISRRAWLVIKTKRSGSGVALDPDSDLFIMAHPKYIDKLQLAEWTK